jgi:flagellar biosynthesis/type III secretory pathway protein FliH
MTLSSRSAPESNTDFVAWLAPKRDTDGVFTPGLDAKSVAGGMLDGLTHAQRPEASAEGFTVWQPRKIETVLADQGTVEGTDDSAALDALGDEAEAAEPLQFTQTELQQYGDNQYQQGMLAAREEDAATLGETRARLDALVATLSEQRVDATTFYEPLKHLLIKGIEAVLRTPLVESRASVEATLAHLLHEVDKDSDGEASGVRLFLNPQDLALLTAEQVQLREEVKYGEDASLSRGSMRAVMQASIIEDLSETRLAQITKQLLATPPPLTSTDEPAAVNEQALTDDQVIVEDQALTDDQAVDSEHENEPEL